MGPSLNEYNKQIMNSLNESVMMLFQLEQRDWGESLRNSAQDSNQAPPEN
jgi:hypothetical protein